MRPSENPDIKEAVKIIQSLGTKHGAETVYRDWCRCYALSIANSVTPKDCELWKQREAQYLEVIGRYDKDEVDQFPKLCAHLTMAFERDPYQDYLGCIYMELFGGQKKLGQCFTPIDICKLCAITAIETPVDGEIKTLADKCVGGGAMLIAACWWYAESKVDYQRWLKITAGDVDSLCVHMTYIQLSLLGARAEVYHRDAITRECWDRFITPMEILWPMKYNNLPDNPNPDSTEKDGNVIKLEIPQETKLVVSIESLIEV